MATANELLAIARKQLGICESPPGSNNVRYNTWYYGREVMGSAYPWCMVFVQWVFAQAVVKLPVRTASCGALMNAAKARGRGDLQFPRRRGHGPLRHRGDGAAGLRRAGR